MARTKKETTMTQEQRNAANLNRKALKMALGSMIKRGITLDDLCTEDAVFTLDVMRGKYWTYYSGQTTREELITAIEMCWSKYQDRISV